VNSHVLPVETEDEVFFHLLLFNSVLSAFRSAYVRWLIWLTIFFVCQFIGWIHQEVNRLQIGEEGEVLQVWRR